MRFRHTLQIIFVLTLLLLPGCIGSGFPKEAFDGVASPHIAFTVWEQTLSIANGDSTIEIVEVKRIDGQLERRAILRQPGEQRYLGPLASLPEQLPVEMLMVDVEGQPVLIGWVDRLAPGEPTLIELQTSGNGTDTQTNTSAITRRGFAIPISANEAVNWLYLSQVVLHIQPTDPNHTTTAASPEQIMTERFELPLFIGRRFLGLEAASTH